MPLLFKYTEPLLGVWKIEESSDQLLAMLGMPSVYLPFLQQIKTEKRRQEWLASRVLLKELAGEELQIAYYKDGAPYLLDSSLFVSISHTTGYATVLLQELPAAGVDIEYRSGRVLKIRSRFMSSEEEAALCAGHEVEHLLVHWCAKEALFKMIRQQDVDFTGHLHVEPFLYAGFGTFRVYETKTPAKMSFLLKYEVTPDFVLVYSFPAAT